MHLVRIISLFVFVFSFILSSFAQEPAPRKEIAQEPQIQKIDIPPKIVIPSADSKSKSASPQAAPSLPPSLPQGQAAVPPPSAPPPAGVPPPPNLQFRKNLPPAIFVRGKEGNINRVFIEPAAVCKEIKVELIMFDIDPNEKLNPAKPYGIPANSSFKVESNEAEKNRATATFTWTPTDKDVGLHAFAFEISNSKNEPNRVALFFDVK